MLTLKQVSPPGFANDAISEPSTAIRSGNLSSRRVGLVWIGTGLVTSSLQQAVHLVRNSPPDTHRSRHRVTNTPCDECTANNTKAVGRKGPLMTSGSFCRARGSVAITAVEEPFIPDPHPRSGLHQFRDACLPAAVAENAEKPS